MSQNPLTRNNNVGLNGDTRLQQRTENHIYNIHAGYLAVIIYNNYWYNSYTNQQAEKFNQKAVPGLRKRRHKLP
ncbi:hypothetical protein I4U23_000326 [Adineta vaga]|nr:hypothetical protein I4U23_000326 [Adineta vaga]